MLCTPCLKCFLCLASHLLKSSTHASGSAAAWKAPIMLLNSVGSGWEELGCNYGIRQGLKEVRASGKHVLAQGIACACNTGLELQLLESKADGGMGVCCVEDTCDTLRGNESRKVMHERIHKDALAHCGVCMCRRDGKRACFACRGNPPEEEERFLGILLSMPPKTEAKKLEDYGVQVRSMCVPSNWLRRNAHQRRGHN